jgi:hypothetical protein
LAAAPGDPRRHLGKVSSGPFNKGLIIREDATSRAVRHLRCLRARLSLFDRYAFGVPQLDHRAVDGFDAAKKMPGIDIRGFALEQVIGLTAVRMYAGADERLAARAAQLRDHLFSDGISKLLCTSTARDVPAM